MNQMVLSRNAASFEAVFQKVFPDTPMEQRERVWKAVENVFKCFPPEFKTCISKCQFEESPSHNLGPRLRIDRDEGEVTLTLQFSYLQRITVCYKVSGTGLMLARDVLLDEINRIQLLPVSRPTFKQESFNQKEAERLAMLERHRERLSKLDAVSSVVFVLWTISYKRSKASTIPVSKAALIDLVVSANLPQLPTGKEVEDAIDMAVESGYVSERQVGRVNKSLVLGLLSAGIKYINSLSS